MPASTHHEGRSEIEFTVIRIIGNINWPMIFYLFSAFIGRPYTRVRLSHFQHHIRHVVALAAARTRESWICATAGVPTRLRIVRTMDAAVTRIFASAFLRFAPNSNA